VAASITAKHYGTTCVMPAMCSIKNQNLKITYWVLGIGQICPKIILLINNMIFAQIA
jgi:hypothetical protein